VAYVINRLASSCEKAFRIPVYHVIPVMSQLCSGNSVCMYAVPCTFVTDKQ
jgi:hypothetical protein